MGSRRRTDDRRRLPDLSLAIQAGDEAPPPQALTARIAGELRDLRLDVSPSSVPLRTALRNMAKAINLALQLDFLETRLEPVYEVARVRAGVVEILHREYLGLGDGWFASFGRVARSVSLTLNGPDPAGPKASVGGPVRGVVDLMARKLNLIQEYEDKVPAFVDQMLDRLEAVHMIVNWRREEWDVATTVVGLDVRIQPALDPVPATARSGERRPPGKKAVRKTEVRKKTRRKPEPRKAGDGRGARRRRR